MPGTVLTRRTTAIAVVTIDRPAHPKACDLACWRELAATFRELAATKRWGWSFLPAPVAARLKETAIYLGVPEALALFEITFFAGLRKAGMPEE
jgi:hypothetical protein